MPSALPPGDPVPDDGSLPASALDGVADRTFGVYVHVPFCATRCGYCDFNTYTATEGVSQVGYLDALHAELELAARVLEAAPRPVGTVFVGGGTPTLLPAGDLGRILEWIDQTWGLATGAEVTTEANPESVDLAGLRQLRRAGFTRVSLGMQSMSGNVLRVLDRSHTPGRAAAAAQEAREAGFEHVNLDLIYGTPGERADDFAASLAGVLAAGVDHVSAYALTVEEGTRLAARIRRGELVAPDDDVAADRYLLAEATLSAAGFSWYEISNWARGEAGRCRHNLAYWSGADWWGLGPGAHSHVGGVRWWNVRHPTGYAERLADGRSPGHAREVLTVGQRHDERVLLHLRLASGVPLTWLDQAGQAVAAEAADDGLLDPVALAGGRARLTLRGRLLADAVVLRLLT